MPLLSKRIFNCVKPLTDIKTDEKIFTIPHTKEQIRSEAYPFSKIVRYQKSKMAAPMEMPFADDFMSFKAIFRIHKSDFGFESHVW